MNDAVQQEVSRKNAAAVLDTLGRQDAKIAQQQQRIDGVIAALADLHAKVAALEQFVAAQRAKSMGHGPTVRP